VRGADKTACETLQARATVSHWQDKYYQLPRTLNAACLRVKVKSITILTESPALN